METKRRRTTKRRLTKNRSKKKNIKKNNISLKLTGGAPQKYKVRYTDTNEEKSINYKDLLVERKKNNDKYKKPDTKYIDSIKGEEIIKKLQENNILTLLEEKKSVIKKEKKSNLETRLTTLQYEAVKDYIKKFFEIDQPEFTKDDKDKKIEIWGCKDGQSCFSIDKCSISKGDHIYGIREGIKNYDIIGSHSLWNIIPCTHKQNVTWKKSIMDKINKNLVYDFDKITEEDLKKLSDYEIKNYNKLKRWKKYCEERHANLCWKNGRKIDKLIEEIVKKNLYKLIEDFNSLEKISQELDYVMSDKEKQEYYDNYIDLEVENED